MKPVQSTITVCAASTAGLPCAPALSNTVFKDNLLTQPLANPFTTDANGNAPTFALASGTYTITETAAGFVGQTQQFTISCAVGACTAGAATFTNLTAGTVTATGGGSLQGTYTGGPTFNIAASPTGAVESGSSQVVTITTTATCTFTTGEAVTVSGVGVSGYNGQWVVLSPGCNGTSTFTYIIPSILLVASGSGTAVGSPIFSGGHTTSGPESHTGTETHTGSMLVKTLENTVYVDTNNSQGWSPGSDPCAWINDAQVALPASGGIVDARGVVGAQGCAASFNVGSATQQVQLLLGNAIYAVLSTVNIGQGSEIKGIGTNGTAQSAIQAQNGFTPSGPLIQFSTTTGADAIRIRDVRLDCHQVTNCTPVVDTGGAQDQSAIDSVLLFNYTSKCINIGATSQQVRIDNFTCQASATAASANGITIPSTANHIFIRDGGIGSASAGQQAAGIVCTTCDMEVVGVHFENHLNAISLTGAGNGTAFIAGINGLSNITHMVNIQSTWGGSASIFSVRKNGASHAITNNITFANSFCDDESVGHYILSSGANTPQQIDTDCVSGGGAAYGALGTLTKVVTLPETTAQTAAASNDVCYGDSTAHEVKCSGNNSGFAIQHRTVASTGAVTIGSGTSIAATSLCATTVCGAGRYRVDVYVDITTACTTTGSYIVWLGYTDDQGAKAGSSTTTYFSAAGGLGVTPATATTGATLALASTANFLTGSYTLSTTGAATGGLGSINYGTTATACGTGGPMVGKMYLDVTRLE